MVAKKFGKGDSDRVGKEKTDKPLAGPGSAPGASALVGGVGNAKSPSAKKSGAKMSPSSRR